MNAGPRPVLPLQAVLCLATVCSSAPGMVAAAESPVSRATLHAPSPPNLTPGVWTDITPPAPGLAETFGATNLEISPADPNVIYATIDMLGLWKSTDRGSTWKRMGTPATYQHNGRTKYLDSPFQVEVNPGNPRHLVATQGIRGETLGFWISRDGGESWEMPQGFRDISRATTLDVTSMAIDPVDFNHILLGSHSSWTGRAPGILETRDGGRTWLLHEGRNWPAATSGVAILHDPRTGQGDSNTWLVATDGAGFWRTANGGRDWAKVSDFGIPHGGAQVYYGKDGTLYSGAAHFPVRSRDNGVTWEQMRDGLSYWYYYTVVGDGNTLYTQLAYTGTNGGQGLQPYMTTSEASPGKWTPYRGGTQKFGNGPFVMKFDAANGVMYSVNWKDGIWALKVGP